MITIVCGEDNVSAREYFLGLQQGYKDKGFQIQKVLPSQLEDVVNETSEVPDLFGQRKIFATEGLNKAVSRRGDKVFKLLERIAQNKELEVLTWEDSISQRDLKLKELGKVKEFKPSRNVFQLLDACYPSNLKNFLTILSKISMPQNEIFIHVMLQRHLRNVLLVKASSPPSALQSWQVGKLKNQARHWDQEKLTGFYDGLYKIDSSLKSGKNPHGIKNSIDILACYFL